MTTSATPPPPSPSPALTCPPVAGLTNLGNTCFANTVLQCLIHTLPLSQYFLSNGYLRDAQAKARVLADAKKAKRPPMLGTMCLPFLNEYHKLLFVLWGQRPPHVTPQSLMVTGMRESVIRKRKSPGAPVFLMGRQHDMAEYLQFVFDLMHETTGVPVEMHVHGEARSRRDQMMVDSYEHLKQHFAKEHSVVVDLFAGQYYVQIQTCDNQMPQDHSESYDPFLMLTLALPIGVKACTLYDCLGLMREPEIIDGWKGERTDAPRMIEKRTYIWTPPKVLVIHLKRFVNRHVKNGCTVAIAETLDLTDYCMGLEGPVHYQLHAVGNHEGTSTTDTTTPTARPRRTSGTDSTTLTSHPSPWTDSTHARVMHRSTTEYQTRRGHPASQGQAAEA